MSRKRFSLRTDRGQVALEYALLTTVVVTMASVFFVFYQMFVGQNLYGGFTQEDKAFGLERVVSLPFP
jgi:uncharacterized protein (UPF0333 family)